MTLDLWVKTTRGGLVRADWIVRVARNTDRALVITTVCPAGSGGERWQLEPEEHIVCAADALHGASERVQKHPDWHLVELLARLRAQGEGGVLAVSKKVGRFGFMRFNFDTELELDRG